MLLEHSLNLQGFKTRWPNPVPRCAASRRISKWLWQRPAAGPRGLHQSPRRGPTAALRSVMLNKHHGSSWVICQMSLGVSSGKCSCTMLPSNLPLAAFKGWSNSPRLTGIRSSGASAHPAVDHCRPQEAAGRCEL